MRKPFFITVTMTIAIYILLDGYANDYQTIVKHAEQL